MDKISAEELCFYLPHGIDVANLYGKVSSLIDMKRSGYCKTSSGQGGFAGWVLKPMVKPLSEVELPDNCTWNQDSNIKSKDTLLLPDGCTLGQAIEIISQLAAEGADMFDWLTKGFAVSKKH